MKLAITLLAATSLAALAQTEVERTFTFQNPKTNLQAQELATAIRSTGEIVNLSVTGTTGIFVKGTPAQLELVDWLMARLDLPTGPLVHEVSGDFIYAGDVVRIVRLGHAPSVAAFQEMTTAVRMITQIRRVFTENTSQSVIMRGPAQDLDTARWLFDQLDAPPDAKTVLSRDDVRVLRLSPALPKAELQEIVTAVRSIVGMRIVATYSPQNTVLMRAPADQLEMAAWAFRQLDPPLTAGVAKDPQEYRATGGDDVTAVLYLPKALTLPAFQTEVTRLRTITNIRRVYSYNRPRAVLVRGTNSEVVQARQITANLKASN